jgi:hypothetical protein
MASTPRIPRAELTGFSGGLVKTFTRGDYRSSGRFQCPAPMMSLA